MKYLSVLSVFAVLTVVSCSSKRDYNPDSHLSIKEKDRILQSIIRYLGKLPENVSASEKFSSMYNDYYLDLASRHRFEQYYIDSDGNHYFLISRSAPSLYEKRVAMGGKMKFNESGDLLEYEEVFRTWKMKDDELQRKGAMLFDLMVIGNDLTPYYRVNSTEEYIEFPDEHNYYDKAERSWKFK